MISRRASAANAAGSFRGSTGGCIRRYPGKHIAKSDIPVLVDVWAPWCGPCKVMGPQFEAAAKQAEPKLCFVKLNSDDNQALSGRLGIRGIPTMIMFKGGKEIARVSGAMSSNDILKWAGAQ